MKNLIFLLFLSFQIFVYHVEASQKGKYICFAIEILTSDILNNIDIIRTEYYVFTDT